MAENPNTHDPEYNTEAIHSEADDPWFTREEPADETYHPHDEQVIHQYAENREYAPQERETRTGNVPAYTPLVNTGENYPPEPYDPSPEPNSLHIVTYGTVEDVAFADNPESRETGLVSMSVRDEMDDLIHTDFHTLNPLSLLNDVNVQIGDRVRVDIQDYKNVIEWFVYNYPWLLKEVDLLKVRKSDGPWFTEDMPTTHYGTANPYYGRPCIGGSMTEEPKLAQLTSDYEDWEHQDPESQLDKSYLEIGQRDGNKKITIRQFLQLINDYFHIDDIWKTLRDHEKRLVHLERDLREEDSQRGKRIDFLIEGDRYIKFPHSNWRSDDPGHGFPSRFTGNVENGQFSLWTSYRDSLHSVGFYPWGDAKERGGRGAHQIFAAGTIPDEFKPTTFHWITNYGYVVQRVGGWEYVLNGHGAVDFGFDPDGSVWVAVDDLQGNYEQPKYNQLLGIFGPNGLSSHQMLSTTGGWHYLIDIYSFGGVITIGDGSDGGEVW